MPSLTWTWTDAFVTGSVGYPLDTEVIEEIRDNLILVNAAIAGEYGASTFNGLAGRAITLAAAEADTSYTVAITPTAATGGNLGEVYLTGITTAGFTVHNTGSFTGAFRYKVTR